MNGVLKFLIYLVVSALLAWAFYGLFVFFGAIEPLNEFLFKFQFIKDFLGNFNKSIQEHGMAYIGAGILGLFVSKFIIYSKND